MRVHNLIAGFMAALLLAVPAAAETYRDRSVPIVADADLDLVKYLGLWYEIARFPNKFEKGCQGVTAEYRLRSDGKISVTNNCRTDRPDAPARTAKGVARVEAPGQLSVTFVPWLPFARGDYWVLYVDASYSFAVVGAPKGTTGWVLARTPTLDTTQREIAERILKQNGYDVQKLMDVAH